MCTHNLHVCFGSTIRKNRYTPVNPSFTKVGFEGVYITQACFPDDKTLGWVQTASLLKYIRKWC